MFAYIETTLDVACHVGHVGMTACSEPAEQMLTVFRWTGRSYADKVESKSKRPALDQRFDRMTGTDGRQIHGKEGA